MGHKISSLKVSATVSVVGGSGTVDAVKLSYQRTSCCGRRRRKIASFAFPQQEGSCEGVVRSSSSNVASVPLEKLSKKDGDTPVRVTCLAGKVPVYQTEIALADLLHMLRCTRKEGKGVLIFTLVGGMVKGTEAKTHAFTALFCNGKRCGTGSALPPTESSGHPKDGQERQDGLLRQVEDHDEVVNPGLSQEGALLEIPECLEKGQAVFETTECPGKYEPVFQASKLSTEEDLNSRGLDTKTTEITSPCHTQGEVVQEKAPSVPDTPQRAVKVTESRIKRRKVVKEKIPLDSSSYDDTEKRVTDKDFLVTQEVNVAKKGSASRRRGKHTRRAMNRPQYDNTDDETKGSSLWGRVVDCAAVVAAALVMYNAWQEWLQY